MAFEPAPARGRYDRRLSAAERASRQRDRLLAATARALNAAAAGSPPAAGALALSGARGAADEAVGPAGGTARTAEARTAEARTAEARTAEARTAEARTADARTAEARTLEAPGAVVSVRGITALAGTGRNTFYMHFRDVAQAREAVVTRALELLRDSVERAFERAVTPLEMLRGLLDAWLDALDHDRELARAAFVAAVDERRGGLSRLGSALRNHLRRATLEARRHGALSTPADELRLLAMAAACESLLGWYLDHADGRVDVRELGAELLMRAFR